MTIEFEKIELPEKHVFKGQEFPVAFTVDGAPDFEDILQFLKKKSEEGFFNEVLKKNGAVVLRNLRTTDPEKLSKIVETIGNGSGLEPFVQNGSTAQRHTITEHLSTANEGPSDREIFQHNEFSRFKKYPTTLFFVCTRFNATGGETPIVHGGEFFEEVKKESPEIIDNMINRGVYLEQIWPLVSENETHWSYKYCFGRNIDPNQSFEEQQKTAIKLAHDSVSDDVEFAENGDFIVRQHTKPIRLYNNGETEFPCFFNSVACFGGDTTKKLSGHDKTKNICYDDGTEFDPKHLDTILKVSLQKSYHHTWQAGDIAIVNNYLASHGRKPWNGQRQILVSMWDTPNKAEFPHY
ncbi:hypothetical protein CANINC_004937 [Pichia inconspicua]|uniref:TauD/TfdA-like domain-containing protein n=1 Tax=Pichia inconspicua TaxID=52247 RepID=A0A4T0WUR5_9ASCO|nr:hypothetical protein CANINC_004937 [[Candida] inconspicua]